MLVSVCGLLRRCTHSSVRQQLNGAALHSAADSGLVDFLDSDASDATLRSLSSATASTSATSAFLKNGSEASSFTSLYHLGCFRLAARHASTAAESHIARRREILRDAAQKVSSDSTWLLAYSHNIDPRQLTYRLGKRSTLHALEEGWTLYERKFDTIAMAALLRRLRVAQVSDPAFDPVGAQKLLDGLEPRLRAITMRFGKLRDTIAYLHALAKLRSPLPKAPAPGVAGLVDSAADEDALGVAEPAIAVAAGDAAESTQPEQHQQQHQQQQLVLGQPADLVLDLAAWATRDRTQVLHASPRRLATLLWALLRTVPPELYASEKLQMVLDRIALCSIRQGPNFTSQDLRVFGLAYATFGPRTGATSASSPTALNGGWSRIGRSWAGSVGSWPQLAKKSPPPSATAATGSAGDPATAAGGGTVTGPSARAGASGGAGGEAKTAQRQKRNALVLQVVTDHLARRVGDLTVTQPHPRDLVLTTYAWALQGAPAPHMPLFVKAADAATGGPRLLLALELVLLVETLAKYGVRQAALLETVRQCARGWSAGAEPMQSVGWTAAKRQGLQERLAMAYRSLGVEF